MKKSTILIILILTMAIPCTKAQLWKISKWEVAGGLGTTQFFGDVGGYSIGENFLGLKDITYLQTRFNVNGNVRYRFTKNINARVSLAYGMLHATDERGSNEGRPYEVTTSIFEPAVIGEYYFVKNKSENLYTFLKRGKKFINDLLASLDVYAFTGIGGCAYKVKGNEPLMSNLMSKGFPDKGFAAVIPVGVGVQLIYSANFNFGLELGGRYAFTDFLDGFTSYNNSKANDVYYLFNLTATYKLRTKENRIPVFR